MCFANSLILLCVSWTERGGFDDRSKSALNTEPVQKELQWILCWPRVIGNMSRWMLGEYYDIPKEELEARHRTNYTDSSSLCRPDSRTLFEERSHSRTPPTSQKWSGYLQPPKCELVAESRIPPARPPEGWHVNRQVGAWGRRQACPHKVFPWQHIWYPLGNIRDILGSYWDHGK